MNMLVPRNASAHPADNANSPPQNSFPTSAKRSANPSFPPLHLAVVVRLAGAVEENRRIDVPPYKLRRSDPEQVSRPGWGGVLFQKNNSQKYRYVSAASAAPHSMKGTASRISTSWSLLSWSIHRASCNYTPANLRDKSFPSGTKLSLVSFTQSPKCFGPSKPQPVSRQSRAATKEQQSVGWLAKASRRSRWPAPCSTKSFASKPNSTYSPSRLAIMPFSNLEGSP